jgi:hypothetical protein
MIASLRKLFRGAGATSTGASIRFKRPIVILQSDDWGRVGVCDREGWESLRANGINLGEKPYDYYSLESAEDLEALAAILRKHRDSIGRHPCLGMNFVTANVDFPRCQEAGEGEIPLRPLTDGLPDPWRRPGLMEAYRNGIQAGLFVPALHGLTHFCAGAVAREVQGSVDSRRESQRRELLRKLWKAGTPYIHWRMPWIGYEYWDPEQSPDDRFLAIFGQRNAINRAAAIYASLFGSKPLSACAPGYRANQDTKTAWFEAGVRVVQAGPGPEGDPFGPAPKLDAQEMLVTCRNVEMEPATGTCVLDDVVNRANACLSHGVPAIVSMHSINFHSSLQDFRKPALSMLDSFLSAMEARWPDLLYVHDGELWHIATQGSFFAENKDIKVDVTIGRL